MYNIFCYPNGAQYIIFAIQSNRINSAANNKIIKVQNDIPESSIDLMNASNLFFDNKNIPLMPVSILHIHAAS